MEIWQGTYVFSSPFSEPNFKDLIGSAMKRLVGLRFWNGSNQDKQLACASRRLLEFARMQKLRLQIRKFSKQNLGWTTGRCPEAHIKGYDTYVVLSFLVSEVQSRDCGPLILILCIFLGGSLCVSCPFELSCFEGIRNICKGTCCLVLLKHVMIYIPR